MLKAKLVLDGLTTLLVIDMRPGTVNCKCTPIYVCILCTHYGLGW